MRRIESTSTIEGFCDRTNRYKLIGKSGTCKTGDKDRVLVHRIDPCPVIGTMDP
jgi:hypothetical protein